MAVRAVALKKNNRDSGLHWQHARQHKKGRSESKLSGEKHSALELKISQVKFRKEDVQNLKYWLKVPIPLRDGEQNQDFNLNPIIKACKSSPNWEASLMLGHVTMFKSQHLAQLAAC